MFLEKKTIKGEKGKTVCYSIQNLRFDSSDNRIKWDTFRFYTPEGNEIDSQGFNYFDVPADEVLIERDDTLNKYIMIIVTKDTGTELLEIYEDAEMEAVTIGLEGDIIVYGFIPADTATEITISYKEVTNG